jgi:hypothetical protein
VSENGRIKFTWPQLVWAIATLLAILGQWYDIRTQTALNRQAFEMFVNQDEKDKQRLWEAVRDAQAAEDERAQHKVNKGRNQ